MQQKIKTQPFPPTIFQVEQEFQLISQVYIPEFSIREIIHTRKLPHSKAKREKVKKNNKKK
jgi:hypothetical protein